MWGWLSGNKTAEVPIYPEITTPKDAGEFAAACAKARQTLIQFSQEPGWTDVAFDESTGVKVWSKETEGIPAKAARATGMVNAPAKAIFNACFFTTKEAAQKTDEELLEWKVVKSINDNTVVLYTGHSTPIGVTNRETLVVRGWDEENGTIYIYSVSVNDPEVPSVDGRVRSVVHVGGWIIEPVEDGSKCNVTRVFQLDPKGSIPSFVVNMYIGKVGQAVVQLRTLAGAK